MGIDQRGLLALHREQFTLFAAKAFTTINPGAEFATHSWRSAMPWTAS